MILPIYNIFIDAPMYMKRYKEDQGNHKKYLRFWPGLIDSFDRRIVTHEIKDWSDDMTWMLCYFLFGAWSGMVLMYAPHSKRPSSEDDNKNFEKNIQKFTDINIEKIEKILVEKEKEIIRI